jgi:hypothetical protein
VAGPTCEDGEEERESAKLRDAKAIFERNTTFARRDTHTAENRPSDGEEERESAKLRDTKAIFERNTTFARRDTRTAENRPSYITAIRVREQMRSSLETRRFAK